MNKYSYVFNNMKFFYYLRDDVDFSVFNEVFKLNEYKVSADVIKNAKHPIVDIGAHIGLFSIFAGCLNKEVKIYAIEPENNNFKLLEAHKNENIFNNWKLFKCAIGSNKMGVDGYELNISEDSINHKLEPKIKIKNPKLKTQNVRVFSLEEFLDNNNIDLVSLIKIDIEGGEYDIFENLNEKTLGRIGAFVLEYHDIKTKDQK